MNYEEISKLALKIDNANSHGFETFLLLKEKTVDDLIDVLETTQEILADNTGDDTLTRAVNIFRSMVQSELSRRDKERYK